jgi:hypothetical protein
MEVKVVKGSIFIDGIEYVPKVKSSLVQYSRKINKSDSFFSEMKHKRKELYNYIQNLDKQDLANGYTIYQENIVKYKELLISRLKVKRTSNALHRKTRRLIPCKANRSNFFKSIKSDRNISFKNYKRMKELLNEH